MVAGLRLIDTNDFPAADELWQRCNKFTPWLVTINLCLVHLCQMRVRKFWTLFVNQKTKQSKKRKRYSKYRRQTTDGRLNRSSKVHRHALLKTEFLKSVPFLSFHSDLGMDTMQERERKVTGSTAMYRPKALKITY